jgi:hypothetical protein
VPSTTELLLSLLISSIASGYLVYGRRQSSPPALLSGFALLVLPFLVSAPLLRIGLTLLLMALPILLSRR